MTQDEVRKHLLEECLLAGGQTAWAAAHGFSVPYVHDVCHGGRPPGPRILAALGLAKDVTYRAAE